MDRDTRLLGEINFRKAGEFVKDLSVTAGDMVTGGAVGNVRNMYQKQKGTDAGTQITQLQQKDQHHDQADQQNKQVDGTQETSIQDVLQRVAALEQQVAQLTNTPQTSI